MQSNFSDPADPLNSLPTFTGFACSYGLAIKNPVTMAETYTITNNASGEVTTIILEEDVPNPDTETSPQDTFEVHEYVCSDCGKVYKGLRCLHKHLAICGKPKKAATTTRTRAPKRKSDDDDTSTSPEKSTSEEDRPIKKRELGNTDPPKVVKREAVEAIEQDSEVIEVLPAAEDEESTKELCFCCEEPMKTLHVRRRVFKEISLLRFYLQISFYILPSLQTGPVKCKFCKLSFLTYIGRDNHILNMHNSSEVCCTQMPIPSLKYIINQSLLFSGI